MTIVRFDAESAADRATALRLALACEAAVGIADTTAEEIEALATGPDADRSAHRLALPAAGAARTDAVGALLVEVDRTGREVFFTPFAVGPDATDVYVALIADGLASARALVATDTGATPLADFTGDPFALDAALWQVTMGMFRGEQPLADAAVRCGFRQVRAFYRMHMALDATTTPPADDRTDLALRVARTDDDLRTLHALRNATFADHFGSSHDHPYEEWMASLRAMPGHNPDRLFLVARDGRDVGLLVMDDSKAHEGEDYLRTIGVLADERGHGVGRWALMQAIAMATANGATALNLGVDTDNSSNATALYESVGMRPKHVIDVFVRPVE